MYSVFKETLGSKPRFIPFQSKLPITDKSKDYYLSLFQYTEKQKNQAEQRGTLSGIKDTTTDSLYFDFDSKDDLEIAREDTLSLVTRLIDNNVDPDHMHVAFTGNKGFSLEVKLDKRISNLEFKAAVQRLAGNLKTFDHVVSDPNRVVRIDYTRHQKTGLYKTPISVVELDELSIDAIINKARENSFGPTYTPVPINLDDSLFKFEEKKKQKMEIDGSLKEALATKPRHWKDYKWSLVQGFFDAGERHNALMIIAATCRGLGYDKQTAYYMCKAAVKKQAQRSGIDEFPKEELWENIIENSVYSDNWEGGQYSPSTNPWLAKYCEKMGFDTEQTEDAEVAAISLDDMTNDFQKFSKDFEKNILKTGIRELDENAILTVSTLNGLLGQPGAGKTSMAINYLANTSIAGISSMFFSLDMSKDIVYAKLVQKESGLDFKESVKLFRDNAEQASTVANRLKDKYRNVGFSFRSGTSVADIRRSIKEQEANTGKKVKLVVVDYLECIQSSLSDPTAGAGQIAGQLKDVANDEEVCILLLLQTQKHSTPEISDPLLSLKQVKGSSVVEQSCSTILTLWREGYSPKYVNDDKYISFAVVKNRFGGLWSGDFGWNGLRGDIRSLADEEKAELKAFRKRKKEEKAKTDAESSEGWK